MVTVLDDLLPYIIFHVGKKEYTAYICYKTFDPKIINIAHSTYLISELLNLPTDQSDYNPSYTYAFYSNNKFEIGIIGKNLDKIYESIKIIQTQLKKANCQVNENLKNIQVENI